MPALVACGWRPLHVARVDTAPCPPPPSATWLSLGPCHSGPWCHWRAQASKQGTPWTSVDMGTKRSSSLSTSHQPQGLLCRTGELPAWPPLHQQTRPAKGRTVDTGLAGCTVSVATGQHGHCSREQPGTTRKPAGRAAPLHLTGSEMGVSCNSPLFFSQPLESAEKHS